MKNFVYADSSRTASPVGAEEAPVPLFLESQGDLSQLPEPGEVLVYDYTEEGEGMDVGAGTETDGTRIRAVQWNIERGYRLEEVIGLLGSAEHVRADVFCLQELDIHCARSSYSNNAQEVARALKARCVFVCEFEEQWSREQRTMRNQGGGVHGNAIVTRWAVERVEVLALPAAFDWARDGARIGEPRRGGRYALAAFLRHPRSGARVLVYSVHLEVFCGIFARLKQFAPVLAHARRHADTHAHQMVLGDLNTMAHGLARLFPKYCCDALRWRSLGWSEAAWWQRNLFSVTDALAGGDAPRNALLAAHHHSRAPRGARSLAQGRALQAAELIAFVKAVGGSGGGLGDGATGVATGTDTGTDTGTETETLLLDAGAAVQADDRVPDEDIGMRGEGAGCGAQPVFTEQELSALVNPFFHCPFSCTTDMTLQMRGYAGKLDWMLVRGLRVLRHGLDNADFRHSDHKLLWLEAEFRSEPASDVYALNTGAVGSEKRTGPGPGTEGRGTWAVPLAVGVGMGVALAGVIGYRLLLLGGRGR